jgi:hypothetical protein
MLYAAIDIHKHVFQAAVFDPESGGWSRAFLGRSGRSAPPGGSVARPRRGGRDRGDDGLALGLARARRFRP